MTAFTAAPSSKNSIRTATLGFPRMGRNRELKFALESFWKRKITEAQLLETAANLRRQHWQLQRDAGSDIMDARDRLYAP